MQAYRSADIGSSYSSLPVETRGEIAKLGSATLWLLTPVLSRVIDASGLGGSCNE
jgi:hypothetical protein